MKALVRPATALLLAVLCASARGENPPLKVPAGSRAMPLLLDPATAETLAPGDRVDILLETAELSSKGYGLKNLRMQDNPSMQQKLRDGKLTLLTKVLLLDVRKPSESVPRATLQLAPNPNEAQYLALAQAMGLKITVEPSQAR